VRDEGDQLLRLEAAAQRTSTGPTATSGVSVSSSSFTIFSLDIMPSPWRTVVRDKGDFPRGHVDYEEGETDYYNPTQLKEHMRARQVWSPVKFKQLRNYLFNVLPKSMEECRRDTREILTTSSTSRTHSSTGCQLSIAIATTSPSSGSNN
jgi:hypothetical protein